MKKELKSRLAKISATLEVLARPFERDPQQERLEAVEEAALEGAIVVIDKLHELTGLAPTPEAKEQLAAEIKKLLL